MSTRIIPAIMSGGAGTRLWPLSTEERPKQFHALGGAETLFAQTLSRVSGDAGAISFTSPIVLCNARHEHLVRASAPGAMLVLEPLPRNTAAVGAIAAAVATEIDPTALVLLLPSDHVVRDVGGFHAALARAVPFANARIVTFGITPNRPATGYGYIKRGNPLGDGVFEIEAFKEKPDAEAARQYLATDGYTWNAGIFLFHPQTLLAEFAQSADVRDAALEALDQGSRRDNVIELDAEAFAGVRSTPLDIAVMEKTKRAAVAPCDIGWTDIGSWDEVWRVTPRDSEGFAMLGPAAAADARKMEASGVSARVVDGPDLVVVAAPDGLLILPRAMASDRALLRAEAAQL